MDKSEDNDKMIKEKWQAKIKKVEADIEKLKIYSLNEIKRARAFKKRCIKYKKLFLKTSKESARLKVIYFYLLVIRVLSMAMCVLFCFQRIQRKLAEEVFLLGQYVFV